MQRPPHDERLSPSEAHGTPSRGDLTSRLLVEEEHDRRRLARELHDGLNQLVTLALLKLGLLKDHVDGRARELTDEIETILDKAGASARSLTFRLSPPILHDLGLSAAMHWLADDLASSHSLRVELEGTIDVDRMEDGIKLLLFRSLREVLVLLVERAGATHVQVRFTEHPEHIEVLLADDGGDLAPAPPSARGVDQDDIAERLKHLGGDMVVESHSTTEPRIRIHAPLPRA